MPEDNNQVTGIRTVDYGAPDRICLQLNGDENPDDYDDPYVDCSRDISWCWERIFDHDVMYIRADNLQAELDLEIERLHRECKELKSK